MYWKNKYARIFNHLLFYHDEMSCIYLIDEQNKNIVTWTGSRHLLFLLPVVRIRQRTAIACYSLEIFDWTDLTRLALIHTSPERNKHQWAVCRCSRSRSCRNMSASRCSRRFSTVPSAWTEVRAGVPAQLQYPSMWNTVDQCIYLILSRVLLLLQDFDLVFCLFPRQSWEKVYFFMYDILAYSRYTFRIRQVG